MGRGFLILICALLMMPLIGRAAQVELGLVAVDRTVPPPAETQPDATTKKKPPQLGLGPSVTPAPAVVTRVIVEQQVVRVPTRRRAR